MESRTGMAGGLHGYTDVHWASFRLGDSAMMGSVRLPVLRYGGAVGWSRENVGIRSQYRHVRMSISSFGKSRYIDSATASSVVGREGTIYLFCRVE